MTLIFFWQHIACVTEQAWYVFGNLDNKKAFYDGKINLNLEFQSLVACNQRECNERN